MSELINITQSFKKAKNPARGFRLSGLINLKHKCVIQITLIRKHHLILKLLKREIISPDVTSIS